MPVFGSRKGRQEAPSPEADPTQAELSAQQRYDALLAQRAELEATIASHREERERLLHQAEVPALGAITALAGQVDAVRLQLEWIDRQLPDLQAEIAEEQRAAWEAAWETHRPVLAEAEMRLADAIREFNAALAHAHAAHTAARGFGSRVTDEFVRPFPAEGFNPWALAQYLATIERRKQAAPQFQVVELSVEFPPDLPRAERFVPRRVPRRMIEQVSPLSSRKVHVLHSVNVTNLNFGHRLLTAGTTMEVPGPAAFCLTYSGCAEYADETANASAA